MGCGAVITVMHAGTEYDPKPDGYQRQIVAKAAPVSSLIVGHHPHIVQGVEDRDGVPVVYSLGNCVFGGNGNPKDHDALALQAELHFDEGELTGITLHFYPISVTGEANFNDYSPVLLEGKGAERVLRKMEESTGVSPGMFDRETGAVMDFHPKK
jgi:poly-gamma-glutamate synthesis protein (capsule biosynthesis protein)